MCGVDAASIDTGVDRVDVCRSRRVDVGGRIDTGNARAVPTGVGVSNVGVSIVSERVEHVEPVTRDTPDTIKLPDTSTLTL